ncbi:MAG: hypothetical protein BGO49_04565 [Planctomycetales bacterium 71-10]|nr:MAG: hypothetical protein BGO49_04565 [Planctomycetales bacterium 71-10]
MVTFVTTGVFTASGTSVLQNLSGLDISFDSGSAGPLDLSIGDFSNVSFGQFNTSFTSAPTDQIVSSGFTLEILQASPSFDNGLSFSGSISGTISVSGSKLIVQFNGPLVITSADGLVQYRILNADEGTPGRISVGAPNANNGLTSVNGRITLVPEPSAFALLGLGVPAVLLYRRRRAA